jgi:hypothetical protein
MKYEMANLSLFDNASLTARPYGGNEGICARELLHLVVTGVLRNETPKGLTLCCKVLVGIENAPWRDNAHCTAVLIPYLRRLIGCVRDETADLGRAFGLANYVCRILLPDFLETISRDRIAIQLRALPPIVDAASARVTAKTLEVLAPTIYIDRSAFNRGTRALLDDAIRSACRDAKNVAYHAAEGAEAEAKLAADADGSQHLGTMSGLRAYETASKGPEQAAYYAGTAALWIARAICYANSPPPPFWFSVGHAAHDALASRAGLLAGGAAIERYVRAMLNIILETR